MFDEIIDEMLCHINAYRTGHIDQDNLILLMIITIEKMILNSDKTIKKLAEVLF